MTVREYIGARYVPLFMGEWDITKTYEPLSIVIYEGNSFTSTQYVPENIDITNTVYWVETGNYNAQIEQYRQEVRQFDDRINDIAISDIQTEIITAYLSTNGNDNTAILNDREHPFATLDKAVEKLAKCSRNYRFQFLDGGTFNLHANIITGSVWHFCNWTDSVSGYGGIGSPDAADVTINVLPPNREAQSSKNLYVYDSHMNIWSNHANNKIYFNVLSGLGELECEGSTLMVTYSEITCKRLYLIQGGCRLTNVVLNGWLDCLFIEGRFNGLTINNQIDNDAMHFVECQIREDGNGIYIVPNHDETNNNSTRCILHAWSSELDFLKPITTSNVSDCSGYYRSYVLDACKLTMSPAYKNNFELLCDNESIANAISIINSGNDMQLDADNYFNNIGIIRLFSYDSNNPWNVEHNTRTVKNISKYSVFVIFYEAAATPLFGFRTNSNILRCSGAALSGDHVSTLFTSISIGDNDVCTLQNCGYLNHTAESSHGTLVTNSAIGAIYAIA